MSPPDPYRREDLLTAAGRDVQPTMFGWETLPTRLAQTPQVYPGRLGRWATLPIGVGVVAAGVLVILWLLMPRHAAQAREQPIEVRRESVDLTVLSMALTEQET